jgi:cobalt-zinc-cadmium efflux system membrane fusion protein
VSVEIKLTRFGGKVEVFAFSPSGEFLRSQRVVEEPHSFEVLVNARYRDSPYSWHFDSFEGRTVLSDDALKVAQVEMAKVGPGAILNSTTVYGRILADEDRVAHLGARFPGVVRAIRKSFGDTVQKGDILAIIESNQNLQPYELRAQIGGVVIQRHAVIGEVATDSQPLFIVADLSRVWADFHVYRDDIGTITVGQSVRIELGNGKPAIEATVAYVSPVTDEATQSKLIRAVLPNPRGELRPGLFVSGTLIASETKVAVAVRREAIQTFRDWNVVYLTDGHTFQAAPVTLGRSDPHFIEVISGVEVGDTYVAKNSFIIKADVEKSAASHDH